MQRYLTPRRIAAAIVVAALLAAAPVLYARLAAEGANRGVELAIDLDETEGLALSWGVPVPDLLASLRQCGLTAVAVEDITLERLERLGRVALFDGGALRGFISATAAPHPLLAAAAARGEGRADAAYGRTYALATDAETSNFLQRTASRAFGDGRVQAFGDGEATLIEVAGARDEVRRAGLGIWPGDLRDISGAGLSVIARPGNPAHADERAVREVFSELDGAPVSVICFAGYQALGFPGALSVTADEIARRGWLLGMVEAPVQRGFILQDGTADLAAALGYRVARVYAISRKELDKISVADALDRWLRGTKERNIRVVYLRPLLAGEAQGWQLEATRQYVAAVAGELRRAGFVPGTAQSYPPLVVRLRYAFPMACGVIAAGLLLLIRLWPRRLRPPVLLGLGAGLAAAWFGVALVASPLARLGAALGASIVFPALAVLWAADRYCMGPARAGGAGGGGRAWAAGIGAAVGATAITLAGAAFIGALLGDTPFMLEMDYFRGVKLSYLAPLALIAFGYLRSTAEPDGAGTGRGPGWGGLLRRATALLERRLTAFDLLLLLALAAGALLYIGRAGHESGIPVMGLEVKLRALLEHTLVARPRLKEFVIGHPAMLVAAFLAARGGRGWVALLLLGAGVGQVSVINSFEHLRTPLMISLMRTGNGLLMGVAVGAAAAAVVWGVLRLARRGPRPASRAPGEGGVAG